MRKKEKRKSYKKGTFTSQKIRRLILSIFKENPTKKRNYKQVCKEIGFNEVGLKFLVRDCLYDMVEHGVLKELSRGSFSLVFNSEEIRATVKNTNKRGVYVVTEKFGELFISKEHSLFSLSGDEVLLSVFKGKKRTEAKIINVVKRKKTSFVGKIDNSSGNLFFIADNKNIYFDVFINERRKKQFIFKNKKVLVSIIKWETSQKNPVGVIVRVIGNINCHDAQVNSILYDYGFDSSFSSSVKKEAEKSAVDISNIEISRRFDMRKITTFTIDPYDAKDFDDALSVKKFNSTCWEIGVHIADVSHYVIPGGSLDKEAFKRGTSVYLVDRVIPMLPEVLSNNICSLKPKEERLAFSVIFKINNDGKVLDYSIKKTVIYSDYRFNYQEAQEIIDKKNGPFFDELNYLNTIAKKLRKKRKENGSIGFESKEVKFVLDQKKEPVSVEIKKSIDTNHLIEEFMLLANKTISKHVEKAKCSFIYRVHDKPDLDRLNDLAGIVKKLGYNLDLSSSNSSSAINTLLENVKNSDDSYLVESLAMRAMSKAIYSTNNIGHYGLSFDFYSHFTSPIRRYPDIIVHRLLNSILEKKSTVSKDFLVHTCNHCSEQEKLATKAERDSIKFMQVKFLKSRIGKCYNGIISGVTDWGMYVELTENKCEGLVRLSSIKDDHYIFNAKNQMLEGYQTKKTYTLGQKIKIKIISADLEKNQMYFSLI